MDNSFRIVVIFLLTLSCSNERTVKKSESNNQSSQNSQTNKLDDSHSNRKTALISNSPLLIDKKTQLTVLGIKLPAGMKPKKSPSGVYRYEGLLPPLQLKNIVESQVSSPVLKKETSGFIFRFAHVPDKNNTPLQIGIRIAKKSGGGAVIDFWIEKQTAEKTDHNQKKTHYPLGGSAREQGKKSAALGKLLNVMDRMNNGESVSIKELNEVGM